MTRRRFASWPTLAAVLAITAFGLVSILLAVAAHRENLRSFSAATGATLEVLPDPVAKLTLDEVIARPDSAWSRWDGPGYIRSDHGGAVWLRVTVNNPDPQPRRGVFADAEYFADHIELWTRDATQPDGWRHQRAGEWVPAAEKTLWGRDPAFVLELPARGECVAYLRVKDHFGAWLRPVWWPRERDFLAAQLRATLGEACYFGVLLALFVYNGVLWARLRHRDLGHYLGYLGSMGVFVLMMRSGHQVLGFAFGSPFPECLASLSMALSGFFVVQFIRAFLDLPALAPRVDWLVRLMRALMIALAVASLSLPWSNNTLLLHLTVAGTATTQAVLIVAALLAWRAGSRQARYFLFPFGLFLCGLMPTAVVWLLAIPVGLSPLSLMLGSGLEMLLLSLALSDRFARLQRDTTAARLAEESARLETLRYQLNPHFLYNVLGSIRSLVHSRPAAADEMTTRLADFCRLTLTRDDATAGTLGDELKLITTYLDIERTRWREHLQTRLDADPAALASRVPPFLLLPLVENAVKYGTRTSEELVRLVIIIGLDATGALLIEVANTGRWVGAPAPGEPVSTGIGLVNLRQRLARYYPSRHTFTTAEADGWVRVTLRLVPPTSSAPETRHA